jgi:hypothetical protein
MIRVMRHHPVLGPYAATLVTLAGLAQLAQVLVR